MLYLVIFIFLIIIIIILLLKVTVEAKYIRNGWDDNIVLSIFFLKGIMKIKYEIPLVDIGTKGIRYSKVKKQAGPKETGKKEKEDKKGFIKLIEEIGQLRDSYCEHRDLITKIKKYLSCKLVFDKLQFNILIGTGDSYYTGIVGGMVWSLVGIVDSYISHHFKVIDKVVDIKTNFYEKKLNMDLSCIFNIKFVHIIVVRLMMRFYQLRNKLRNRRKSRKKYNCHSKNKAHSG